MTAKMCCVSGSKGKFYCLIGHDKRMNLWLGSLWGIFWILSQRAGAEMQEFVEKTPHPCAPAGMGVRIIEVVFIHAFLLPDR